jgi:hypothetical protein
MGWAGGLRNPGRQAVGVGERPMAVRPLVSGSGRRFVKGVRQPAAKSVDARTHP